MNLCHQRVGRTGDDRKGTRQLTGFRIRDRGIIIQTCKSKNFLSFYFNKIREFFLAAGITVFKKTGTENQTTLLEEPVPYGTFIIQYFLTAGIGHTGPVFPHLFRGIHIIGDHAPVKYF